MNSLAFGMRIRGWYRRRTDRSSGNRSLRRGGAAWAAGAWAGAIVTGIVGILSGCGGADKRVETRLAAGSERALFTIAVAPGLNHSGSTDFDPLRFADLMAVELNDVDGIAVIPVNRVLAALAAQGRVSVESPSHALEVCNVLGADAVLLFAVSEYDPYDPPRIGISAQLYGARPGPSIGTMGTAAIPDEAGLPASASHEAPGGLLVQTQRVFDASHESVVRDLREFARRRSADNSAYGWRQYVVSQQHFISFCCHATIRRLLGQDQGWGRTQWAREVRKP